MIREKIRYQSPYSLNVVLLVLCIPLSLFAAHAITSSSKMMMLGILALIGCPAVILVLRHPALVFWALLLSSPFNDYLGIQLGGLNVRPYSGLTALGVVGVVLTMTFYSKNRLGQTIKKVLPLYVPLILLLVSKIMTVVTLSDLPPGMGKFFVIKYVIFSGLLFGTGFIIATHVETKTMLLTGLKIWIHIANIIVIIAFIQLIASNTMGMHWVHHRDVISIGRPFSVFREPDVLGSFYGATILMVMPFLINKFHLLPYRYLWATVAFHTVGVITLLVRASWVALVVCFGVLVLSQIKMKSVRRMQTYLHKGVLLSILGTGLLLVLAPSFIFSLTGRFMSMTKPEGEGASEYRMRELTVMAAKTLQIRNPETMLLGHGDFSWSYWAPALLGEKYDRTAVDKLKKTGEVLIHPGFCMPLTSFFDNGIIGCSLFFLFFILFIKRFWRSLGDHLSSEDNALILSTFLPVLALLVCFIFSYDPISPFFWVLIGLHIAATLLVKHKDEEFAHA